ncbi:hypothetical protein AMECASPLE_025659, partial [Ameca splendens]
QGGGAGNLSGSVISEARRIIAAYNEPRCSGPPTAPFPSCTATVLWGYAADLLPQMSSDRDVKQQTFSNTEAGLICKLCPASLFSLVPHLNHSCSKHLTCDFR